MRRALLPACAAAALAAAPLSAQRGYVYASAESGTDSLSMVSAGATVFRGGGGWSPVGLVQAYTLRYPAEAGAERTGSAASAGIGARFQGRRASGQLTASYGVVSRGDVVREGPRGGIATAALADVAPTPRTMVQGIASYHWADRYGWGRMRASYGVSPAARVGVEATVQGHVDERGTATYRSSAIAPLVQLRVGPRVLAAVSLGPKRVARGGGDPTAHWSGRLELVLIR
ncbi:MAG TPA: hypothetical protein VF613_22140 [Longimicrobium sp.]|jgi:hypothetical protein